MVESIKGRQVTSTRLADQPETRRTTFKQLSSGTSVVTTPTNEVAAHTAPSPAVREVARDLEKLRKDINSVVKILQDKAAALEVMGENITSSDARLEDVKAAEDHAASTGSRISFNETEAMGAHNGLTPSKVAELLQD